MSLSTADFHFFHLLDVVMNSIGLFPILVIATLVFGCGKKRPQPKAGQKGKNNKSKKANGSKRSAKSVKASKSKSSKSQKSTSNSSKKSKHPRVEKIKENLKEAPLHAAEALHLRSKDAPKSAQSAQLDQAKGNLKEAKKLAGQEVRERTKSHSQESARSKGRCSSAKTAKELESSRCKEAQRSGYAVPANWNDGQKLSLEPQELRWKQSGGLQNVSLYNKSGSRQAVKVKCSDNLLYRVNPVYAFVEDGQALKVDIVRENGSAKVDKIVLLTAKAGPNDASPKDLFKANGQHQMIALPLIATASAL